MLLERARPDPLVVGASAVVELLELFSSTPLGNAVLAVETESRDPEPKALAWEVTGRLSVLVELGRLNVPLVKGKAGGG
jgi:hypothetical protein